MPRLPRVTADDAIRALRRDGWYTEDQAGSHAQLTHATKHGKVTLPMHRGKILKPKTLATILKQVGLTVDQFR